MSKLAAALASLSLIGTAVPCTTAPTPHIHVTETDDNWQPSASCPTGWQASITPKAADAYNNGPKRKSDAINMLADAPCVRK